MATLGARVASPGAGGLVYSRRWPELGTLYRVVREKVRTLYAAAQDGFAGATLPPFVRQEFEGYLDCGLRQHLAYDGKLLSAVGRIFVDSVLGFYRRRMRAEGVTDGRSGAVTVVQRCNSDLKLSPHLHVILVDGLC